MDSFEIQQREHWKMHLFWKFANGKCGRKWKTPTLRNCVGISQIRKFIRNWPSHLSQPSLSHLWQQSLSLSLLICILFSPASESTISHFKPHSHFPISEHLDLINSHITKRYFATPPSLWGWFHLITLFMFFSFLLLWTAIHICLYSSKIQ